MGFKLNETHYYNLGQKIVKKFIKLSNSCFSMECFIPNFSQFWSTTVKIRLLGGRLNTFPSIPNISEISLKCPNFLRSKVLSRLATRDATRTFTF